jgi:hypothetical protein
MFRPGELNTKHDDCRRLMFRPGELNTEHDDCRSLMFRPRALQLITTTMIVFNNIDSSIVVDLDVNRRRPRDYYVTSVDIFT